MADHETMLFLYLPKTESYSNLSAVQKNKVCWGKNINVLLYLELECVLYKVY